MYNSFRINELFKESSDYNRFFNWKFSKYYFWIIKLFLLEIHSPGIRISLTIPMVRSNIRQFSPDC